MRTTSPISLERETPQIARLTYTNSPVNLMVPEGILGLRDALAELEADADVKVVVLSSDVDAFFVNHFDGERAGDLPGPDPASGRPLWTDAVLRLAQAPFVSVASIRGCTRGAGSELALACDLRYASRERASFGQPEVGIGLVPGGGGTEWLPRALGRDRALEAILTSADYDADIAERWGWVTRSLPDAELDAFVEALVGRLATFDREALAAAKGMINRASLPPEDDLVAAFGEFAATLEHPGYLERATRLGTLAAADGLDVELRLGEYIARANEGA